MFLWRRSTFCGCQLVMLLTFAAVASSADMCWPSVQLRNTAESISDGLPLTEAAIPTALWVGGLPCLRNGACCSKELYLGQDLYKRLTQNANPGLVRISQGHNLAFLAGMPSIAMHMRRVLLASCGSSVEAATLSTALPSAMLYCLQPAAYHALEASNGSSEMSQGATSPPPDWHELIKHLTVYKGGSSDAAQAAGQDKREPLRIDLEDIGPHNVPKTFDIVVIPAEGRELLLSLNPALLHSSRVVLSQGVIERSRIWDLSSLEQQEVSSMNVHMHRSGWEVYAKHSLFSSKSKVRVGSARGEVKIALHITAMSHYRLSVQQHLDRLIFSGLYDTAQGIYCFILGPSIAEIEAAAVFVQKFGRKITIAGNSTDMNLYERFTLLGMRAHLQPEDFFLYLHTKGVTHAVDNLNLSSWVFYMQYFLVKHYAVCLGLLKGQFDTCGVEYRFPDPLKPKITGHYSGNFWWARASYFMSLPESIGAEYTDPEMYIGLQNPRFVALWESNTLLYSVQYPPSEFVDVAATALALPDDSAACNRS